LRLPDAGLVVVQDFRALPRRSGISSRCEEVAFDGARLIRFDGCDGKLGLAACVSAEPHAGEYFSELPTADDLPDLRADLRRELAAKRASCARLDSFQMGQGGYLTVLATRCAWSIT